jgi:hypothetical protein
MLTRPHLVGLLSIFRSYTYVGSKCQFNMTARDTENGDLGSPRSGVKLISAGLSNGWRTRRGESDSASQSHRTTIPSGFP